MSVRIKRTGRKGHGGIVSGRLLCTTSLSALMLIALPSAAHAQQDRNWDPNGTAANGGGTGTWDTSSSTWSPNADGVSGPYSAWSNAGIDNAIFGGAMAGSTPRAMGLVRH